MTISLFRKTWKGEQKREKQTSIFYDILSFKSIQRGGGYMYFMDH